MPLKFHPRAGQVLVCDLSDFKPPEMVKVRPVVVISPRLPDRGGIVTIVPLSTTPPRKPYPFVVPLSRSYKPGGEPSVQTWAKCDMILNIGLHRLNAFKVGRRKWEIPEMTYADLRAVRRGVVFGLGMGDLFSS
ncbi:type II toxin-antitoxin system PemK/MazF family toxin [Parvularcula maris]|uniref:Type II toxin-antitoxin system PemK/MazF family toxin n=1 Tax=Parvularcula maris TaxID=2965077 RepID=A0A9X2LB42_9PROT|nr:type II toxin-antitoxin system PemK/MazF family toxin [Parvularcula maris]MCQ8186296.1 type II toxin-antitoxin system PemK/MazF family toxin [Parvularcula maris]